MLQVALRREWQSQEVRAAVQVADAGLQGTLFLYPFPSRSICQYVGDTASWTSFWRVCSVTHSKQSQRSMCLRGQVDCFGDLTQGLPQGLHSVLRGS